MANGNLSDQYILPVLCGNTATAHRLAARIYRDFGMLSLICGKPRLRDLFDPCSRTLAMPRDPSDRMRAHVLSSLADARPHTLPLLIPCSEQDERFLQDFRDELECRFVYCDPDRVLYHSPLSELYDVFCS